MSIHEKTSKKSLVFILYCFSFILLWEWIRPIEQLTDTGYIPFFLLFIVMSLLFSLFHVHVIITFVIKSLFIIYSLNHFYYETSFFNLFVVIFGELKTNFAIIFTGQWEQLTNPFRSILFYGLLWIMTYLIDYWLLKQQKIFMFFFITLVYITVLDTFTTYDASGAIVRITIVGFSLLSMLTLMRMNNEDKQLLSRKWYRLLSIMLVISMFSGFVGPKLEPQWPDPVPFLQSAANKGDHHSARRIGYSWDDSQLGGPVLENDELVFTAEVDTPHYWKIETKDYYTGKGWEQSNPHDEGIRVSPSERLPIYDLYNGVELTEQQSTVVMKQYFPHLQYPYGIKYVDTNVTVGEHLFSYHVSGSTGKIVPILEGKPFAVDQYTVTYDHLTYKLEALKEEPDNETMEMLTDAIAHLTQLPENLPERIMKLAEEITEGKDNWYDQVKAIESYFNGAGFTYDLKDVAIPEEDDDYVDQFLFETKRGYCDNYSTSMVVLLRAIGIPARWVKGYTEGEYIGTTPTQKKIYEVTNNQAHSWVEVLFPNVGWVPFEPTKGFSNHTQFISERQISEAENSNKSNESEQAERDQQEKRQRPQLEEKKAKTEKSETFSLHKVKSSVQNNWKFILFIIVFMSGVGVIIYQTRSKWLVYYYLFRFKKMEDEVAVEKAIIVLLKQFERKGFVKQEGQTLRDFAYTIDQFFATNEMSRLSKRYEKYVYKGILEKEDMVEIKQLWENLIKKMNA